MSIHKKDRIVYNLIISDIDSIDLTQSGNGMPCLGIAVIEHEGQVYNTVQIEDLCWLREKLNVGTLIINNSTEDNQTDNRVIE